MFRGHKSPPTGEGAFFFVYIEALVASDRINAVMRQSELRFAIYHKYPLFIKWGVLCSAFVSQGQNQVFPRTNKRIR